MKISFGYIVVLVIFYLLPVFVQASDYTIVAQGCKTKNVFLTQRDLINRLTWQVSGTNLPVQYGIYRDSELTDKVAVVPSSVTEYLDHNREPCVTYTYYIVGINQDDEISDPVVVVVTKDC